MEQENFLPSRKIQIVKFTNKQFCGIVVMLTMVGGMAGWLIGVANAF